VLIKLKRRIFSSLVLTFPNLQQPFEIEIDASDYDIDAVPTQYEHPMPYNSEIHYDKIQKYPTYDKYMYSIM